MKRKLLILACLFLGATSSTYAADNAVVYFTSIHNRLGVENPEQAVGNTQRVALEIARQTNADILELKTVKKYPASYDETLKVVQEEFANDTKVELESIPDVSSYNDIYLGFPIWWATYPKAVTSFLDAANLDNKNIYVFVTHGGSSFGHSIDDLKSSLPNSNIIPLVEVRGSNTEDSSLPNVVKEALEQVAQ